MSTKHLRVNVVALGLAAAALGGFFALGDTARAQTRASCTNLYIEKPTRETPKHFIGAWGGGSCDNSVSHLTVQVILQRQSSGTWKQVAWAAAVNGTDQSSQPAGAPVEAIVALHCNSTQSHSYRAKAIFSPSGTPAITKYSERSTLACGP